jgi:hypothetical protein
MTELCKLAEKYGTDKLGAYTRFYGWFLKPFRESVRKVLEIGIGNVADMKHVPGYQPGASLRMWRDFFPNAAIHGIDIDPEVLMHDERIETFLVSQINPHQLAAFGKEHGPFDLIIDDGDHHPGPQATAAIALNPFLTDDGIYIIEDVGWPEQLADKLPFEHGHLDFFPYTERHDRCFLLRKQIG